MRIALKATRTAGVREDTAARLLIVRHPVSVQIVPVIFVSLTESVVADFVT